MCCPATSQEIWESSTTAGPEGLSQRGTQRRWWAPLRGGHWGLPLSPSVWPSEHLAAVFQIAPQLILMVSNPTPDPSLEWNASRAGRGSSLLSLFTHSWAPSNGGEGLPGAHRVQLARFPSLSCCPCSQGGGHLFFSPQLWPHDPDHKKAAIFLWKDITQLDMHAFPNTAFCH